MNRRRRHSLAFLASLLGHTITVGGFATGFTFRCAPDIEMPDIDIEFTEIELLDPDAIQGEEETPPPEPPPTEPEATPPPPTPDDPTSVEEKPEPPPEPEPEPEPEKPKFATKASKADELAPPQSTFHMLLVPKKIRTLPFSQEVLDIMAPLPDFELLIDKGRFDALRDFDHIVVASPDIRDWTQTFLAVDYKLPQEEVQRAIERAVAANGEVIEWVDDGGPLRGNPRPTNPEEKDADNRWFVFLEGKVAIYVRDEFLPSILAGPADDDRKTAGNFVANLAKMRRFAARQPEAGLQLVFKGLRRNLKRKPQVGGKPLPFELPDDFELSASAAEEPEVVIRMEFTSVVEAKAFAQWWNDEVLLEALPFGIRMMVSGIYRQFVPERSGAKIILRGTLDTDQTLMLMSMIADGASKIARKTPEELAEMKRRRIEALEARKGGKLPPSALDPTLDEPDEPAPTESTAPTEPPEPVRAPAGPPDEPSPTPAEDPAGPADAPRKPNKTPT
ncbi:hypothetical protein [Paraliomyxa miuraensis]|uniref:hypothetical protein n=1 Tax=Paraliomyxa miuraensis TaxID=376150 RepID=UPI00224C9581|nr:hypothetical protein [Paraliomyxa miuraensis]MCX4241904.1 hypothetical protein [Paraliomyxa miuraensis]